MNFAVPLSELCVKSHPSFKMAAIAKMKQIVKNKNKRLKIFYISHKTRDEMMNY
jgi:hypothetical protein